MVSHTRENDYLYIKKTSWFSVLGIKGTVIRIWTWCYWWKCFSWVLWMQCFSEASVLLFLFLLYLYTTYIFLCVRKFFNLNTFYKICVSCLTWNFTKIKDKNKITQLKSRLTTVACKDCKPETCSVLEGDSAVSGKCSSTSAKSSFLWFNQNEPEIIFPLCDLVTLNGPSMCHMWGCAVPSCPSSEARWQAVDLQPGWLGAKLQSESVGPISDSTEAGSLCSGGD